MRCAYARTQLHELQEESWKLELYGELEVLKRQLASLQGLESDLDAAEAVLDATEPGEGAERQEGGVGWR